MTPGVKKTTIFWSFFDRFLVQNLTPFWTGPGPVPIFYMGIADDFGSGPTPTRPKGGPKPTPKCVQKGSKTVYRGTQNRPKVRFWGFSLFSVEHRKKTSATRPEFFGRRPKKSKNPVFRFFHVFAQFLHGRPRFSQSATPSRPPFLGVLNRLDPNMPRILGHLSRYLASTPPKRVQKRVIFSTFLTPFLTPF